MGGSMLAVLAVSLSVADLKRLMWVRWYSSVCYYIEEVPPKSGQFLLTFEVRAKRD